MSFLSPSPNPRRLRRHGVTCSWCDGRGFLRVFDDFGQPDLTDWASPCSVCKGRGLFRTRELVRRLGVHRRDLYRVEELKAGPRVGLRVLLAIAREFPEALS